MPIGAETKNRTFVQQPPAQRSGLILPCRDSEWLQRTFQILWKVSLCVRVATRRRQSLSRDYFFFLEVFFATFLVAAFAVFFAFFAMSSSLKSGSVNMHTPSIDMHNVETISQMQN